ncbi:MAG: GAF domain-containing sensor histidine kinase [Fimbriimonadaceae bacterium]|jgi:signal transduction histidine kinase|nr:GAF domain-containing sensor histidine kinase [Fimbriimonadaceae bacterium]
MAEFQRLLNAVHAATQKLVSAGDPRVLLRDVLAICVEEVGAMGGSIYIHDGSQRQLRFLHVLPEEVEKKLERLDLPDDYGVAGNVFQSGKPEISTYGTDGDPHRKAIVRRTGVTVRNMITVPLQIEGMAPIGVVQLVNKKAGEFDDTDIVVLDTIADVATLAIMKHRLLEQSLRVASLEGMGRGAHDLANKAAVLITFLPEFERSLKGLRKSLTTNTDAETRLYLDLLEGTYTDVFAPYSERIYRYAKLVNDLAAGKQLEPKMKSGNFAAVVREAAEFMEANARRHHVRIVYDIQRDAPEYEFDDLYVIRIVENLVGNAIKAVREMITPEWLAENRGEDDAYSGSVTVRYRFAGDCHVLEISDEGPGMSPSRVRSILSGQARSNWEVNSGSGLGMKLVLELTAAHNAKLSIRSRLGEGSTFEVAFPAQVQEAKPGNVHAESRL